MNKINWVWVSLTVIIIIGLVVYTQRETQDQKIIKQAVKEQVAEDRNDTENSEGMKADFMEGCLEAAGGLEVRAYCECTYNELLESFGAKGLLEFSIDYYLDDLSDKQASKMSDAILNCAYLIE